MNISICIEMSSPHTPPAIGVHIGAHFQYKYIYRQIVGQTLFYLSCLRPDLNKICSDVSSH